MPSWASAIFFPSLNHRIEDEEDVELESSNHHRAISLLIVSAMFCMSGCSSRTPISKGEIAKLLLVNLTSHCDRQTVSIRASRFGTVEAQQAMTWFNKSILENSQFHHEAESSGPAGKRGELSYADGGTILRADWDEFVLPGVDDRDRLSLTACIYVPYRVDLVDSSFDGDHGRVTFRETLRLSKLGQKMDQTKLFYADVIAASMPQDYQYEAALQKAGGGRWSVSSVKLR